jgi:hypothetical protein
VAKGLDDLRRARLRVEELRWDGVGTDDHRLVAAMNRLMSLIRHANPEEVAAFDVWRASEGVSNDRGETRA